MPNLRTIARFIGAHRVVPLSVVRRDDIMLDFVGVDDDNVRFRRTWTDDVSPVGFWGVPVALSTGSTVLQMTVPPAIVSSQNRFLHAMCVNVVGGLDHAHWDDAGNAAGFSGASAAADLSLSDPVAAAVASNETLTVFAMGRSGELRFGRSLRTSSPVEFMFDTLFSTASFSGSAGPVAAPNLLGGVDVVIPDRDGQLHWGSVPPLPVAPTIAIPLLPIGGSAISVLPANRPAMVGGPVGFDVFAVGLNQRLHHTFTPALGVNGWSALRQISEIDVAVDGSVAALRRHPRALDVFAVDTDGFLRWIRFDPLIQDFAGAEVIDPLTLVQAHGGVTAVSRTADTMDVFVFDFDGRLRWARFRADVGWSPLRFVP